MPGKVSVAVVGGDSLLMRHVCDALAGDGFVVTPSPVSGQPVILIDDSGAEERVLRTVNSRPPADVVVCRVWTPERCAWWIAEGASDCLPGDAAVLADLPALLRSVQRRKRDRAAESDALAAFQTLLEHAGGLSGWVDTNLIYRHASAALARFDGRSRSSYPGKTVTDQSPWAGPAVVTLLKRVISQREPVVNIDVRFRKGPSADELGCVAGFYPILGSGGDVLGVGIALMPVESPADGRTPAKQPVAAIRSVGVASAWLDGSARFIGGDDAFQKLVGYPEHELTTLTLRDLIHPQDLRSDTALFDWLAGGADSFHAEHRWIKKGGGTVPVRMALSHDGGRSEINVAVLDLSDVRRTQDLLRRSVAEAESAIAAKDRFLAVLSHELRTPLTPVLASVLTIEKDPAFPAELQAPFELIRRNVELEARLIDDLLDLTRLSKGTLQLNMENVDVHALLRQAVELCTHDASTKAVHLGTHLDAKRDHVVADAARLKQVFWNLIRNAIKFTPSGGTVWVRTADGPGQLLHVTVSDTGIGMEPEAVGRVFSAFEQGEQTVSRQFGGLGLGLTISKALVDRHGGSLTVESAGKHRGTTFSIMLQSTPKPTPPAAPVQNTGAKLRVLIVEDHEDTVRAMKRLLERVGYEVNSRNTVRDAVEAVAATSYDLLISDIGLPDGSGMDLIRQVRHAGSTLRAIAISGFGMDDDIRRSKEAGFQEHLTKPVNFAKLQQMIATLTAGHASVPPSTPGVVTGG